MAIGPEKPPHEDVPEFVNQDRNKHARDPDQPVLKPYFDRRESEECAEQPKHGMNAHMNAEHPPAQVKLGPVGFGKKHGFDTPPQDESQPGRASGYCKGPGRELSHPGGPTATGFAKLVPNPAGPSPFHVTHQGTPLSWGLPLKRWSPPWIGTPCVTNSPYPAVGRSWTT